MSLYEFDDGHLIPARFGQPTTTGLSREHLQAVRSHVLELVGRPLFPVLWEEGDDGRLLALDAAGATVTVEVLRELNAQTLVAALTRAGHSAALGWLDLAARYPSGEQAFRRDWNQFRQALPPRIAPGARIVLVASVITEDLRPALEMLAGSGVEAHQLQLRDFGDGRQLLDIVPVRGPLAQRSEHVIGHQPRVAIDMQASDEEDDDLQLPAAQETDQSAPLAPSAPEVELPRPPAQTQHTAVAEAEGEQPQAARHGETSPPAPPAESGGVGLPEIAAYVGEPITLVWVELRRDCRHEATLQPGGTMTLADGQVFSDPNAAAQVASGREEVDGWRVWRFGEAGASLADAREELSEFQ
ncbi:MAG: hypothetical protein Q4Q03_01935 [Bowdeniella nasicola]|nr:hypothetical protein [Bowdeniella nasicola]